MKRRKLVAAALLLSLTVYTALYVYTLYDMAARLELRVEDGVNSLTMLLFRGEAILSANITAPPEPLPAEACVSSINGTILANGEPIARFHSINGFCLRSGGSASVRLRVDVDRGKALAILASLIAGERLEARAVGVARVQPVFLGLRLPFTLPLSFSEKITG